MQSHALTTEWQGDETVAVRLVSGVDGTDIADTLPLGLEVRLGEGWHTYWRSPGETGFPPQIDWEESKSDNGNLDEARLFYPAPRRHTAFGTSFIGYQGHVLFPIDATLKVPNRLAELSAKVDLLVCKSLCVPKTFHFLLTLPAGEAKRSEEADLIDIARAQVPAIAEPSAPKLAKIERKDDHIVVSFIFNKKINDTDLFIESSPAAFFDVPEMKSSHDTHKATFIIKPSGALPDGANLHDLDLTLTLMNAGQAWETEIKANETAQTAPENLVQEIRDFVFFFVLALMGGLILNVMPCVLPVLSLKLMRVMGHGGSDPQAVRKSFIVTSCGILFSFLVLAGVTIGLKAAGQNFGWGIQFQQPLFLAFLILIVLAFAANLLGFYTINLPRFLQDKLSDPSHPALLGSFATGAFATLLATPCSAPFLGTAVGFALGNGAGATLLIFTGLGLGMSLPYLAVAALPKFVTCLPKPGAWMVRVRQFLGLLLIITACWLGWILNTQMAPPRIAQRISDKASIFWQPFDEMQIKNNIADGKTVFLDITAQWCLTCKVNKKIALQSDEVLHRIINDPKIVIMQADWTTPNAEISSFLHKFGRYGIPFDIVFSKSKPQGILLPEILTKERVIEALDEAQKVP